MLFREIQFILRTINHINTEEVKCRVTDRQAGDTHTLPLGFKGLKLLAIAAKGAFILLMRNTLTQINLFTFIRQLLCGKHTVISALPTYQHTSNQICKLESFRVGLYRLAAKHQRKTTTPTL
jgi:hypothetical protein